MSNVSAPTVVNSAKEIRPVFLFPGQGAQYEGMAEELFKTQPVFREAIEQCNDLLAADLNPGVLDILYGPPEVRSLVHQSVYAQPALFSMQYALGRLWTSWGIVPAYVIGHSLGEFSAACFAGVFSVDNGLRLVARLGSLMESLPAGGKMLAVMTSEDSVVDILETVSPSVVVAVVNAPHSVVISGEGKAIDRLQTEFEKGGIPTTPLRVSQAFHSPLVGPMLDEFRAAVRQTRISPPAVPYISTVTGALVSDEVCLSEYWAELPRKPVRFLDSMRCVFSREPTDFVEIGPASILLNLGRQCALNGQGQDTGWFPSIGSDESDDKTIANSLAALCERGADVDQGIFDTWKTQPGQSSSSHTVTGGSSEGRINDLVCSFAARIMRQPEQGIQPARSLFKLGMDSLMAVEFVMVVERELGVRLPMDLVTTELTVDSVSAYLDAELPPNLREKLFYREGVKNNAAAGSDPVMPDEDTSRVADEGEFRVSVRRHILLREGTDNPPLYFIPAGYGDLFAFQDIVALLDEERPAYGLLPPGTELVRRGASPRASVDWLVSMYVTEIKHVQPLGPYCLAGYSAGGIVAVEVARELMRKGDAVDLLAVLDSPTRVPTWISLIYSGLWNLSRLARWTGFARQMNNRWVARALYAILDEGLCTHVAILRGHEIAPYPGRVTYFRTRNSWVRILNLTGIDKSWRRVVREGLEIHWMPGNHYEMLRGKNTKVLAAALNDCLKRSR